MLLWRSTVALSECYVELFGVVLARWITGLVSVATIPIFRLSSFGVWWCGEGRRCVVICHGGWRQCFGVTLSGDSFCCLDGVGRGPGWCAIICGSCAIRCAWCVSLWGRRSTGARSAAAECWLFVCRACDVCVMTTVTVAEDGVISTAGSVGVTA